MRNRHNPISPSLEVGFLSSGGRDRIHESNVDLTPKLSRDFSRERAILQFVVDGLAHRFLNILNKHVIIPFR
jgi:hypothetical protein